MKLISGLLLSFFLVASSGLALADDDRGGKGLKRKAKRELVQSGLTKYVGDFQPAASADVGDGWTKHTFDPGLDEGPICIAGTPYSVFTKVNNPRKLLIFMQGGGACWQDFYNCNIVAEAQEPPPPPVGIWSDSFTPGTGDLPNPLADYSIVYMPYCDGSVFGGDNAVADPAFQFGPVRFHRGLRNSTAGIDLARDMFPRARKILLAGSSAGGVGASTFAPFLVRFAFGNRRDLKVFNDAGPVAVNLFDVASALARAQDWQFGQFFPASCHDCDAVTGQGTAIINWRLKNDRTIKESFYSTDADETNRFFLNVPTQELYRDLIVTEHGKLHDAYPKRYKRFIRSGDGSHTALQTPLYYLGTANGIPLNEWTADFIKPGRRHYDDDECEDDDDGDDHRRRSLWIDIVEDFVPYQ